MKELSELFSAVVIGAITSLLAFVATKIVPTIEINWIAIGLGAFGGSLFYSFWLERCSQKVRILTYFFLVFVLVAVFIIKAVIQ